jgi:Tfp pilus assembly protein PilF
MQPRSLEWTQLAAANPEEARIHNNLGAALARTGKFEEAIPEYRKRSISTRSTVRFTVTLPTP